MLPSKLKWYEEIISLTYQNHSERPLWLDIANKTCHPDDISKFKRQRNRVVNINKKEKIILQ